MKTLLIVTLFFICAALIGFSEFRQRDKYLSGISDKKLERFFTQYNPSYKTNGVRKSSFKHEMGSEANNIIEK